MLMPKRVKRRKVMRGRMKGKAQRGNFLAYGDYGLVALDPGWVTSNQIEASRVAMTRFIKRGGQVWIKIFPDKPVTAKPAETRMGSGKGAPEYWCAVVKPGRVLFEMKATEARAMTVEQLNEKLASLKKDLFFLRMQHATNQLDNPLKLAETKRDIARVKTVIREKEEK